MLDYTHLEALLAVEQEGSFEAAAKVLGMSPIGVATRIRKLEERMGVPLLTRKPTRPTDAGSILCTYARGVAALESELLTEQMKNALQPSDENQKLRIAISDESQLPLVSNTIGKRFGENDKPWLLDISFIDQDHTHQQLKNGELIAALSSHKQPVHGFKSHHLGTLDYLAVASPDFIKERFPDGVDITTLAKTPCIRRSDDDELCFQWMQRQFDDTVALTFLRMPNLPALIEQCLNGVGWAVLPRSSISEAYNRGALSELMPQSGFSKDLYWHVAAIMADELLPITKQIRQNFAELQT